MTLEQEFFLNILRDYLAGVPTQSVASFNSKELYETAKKHQMLGIVYSQLRTALEGRDEYAQLLQLLQRGYFASEFYFLNKQSELEKIKALFEKEELPFFIVKGFPIAMLYPNPAMRTMGDVDMVVHESDREKAHSLFLSNGFENKVLGEKEWVYEKGNSKIELHKALIYPQLVSTPEQLDFSNKAWDYVHFNEEARRWELDWSYHFVFLILHLRKHFLNQGVGFRLFMDLAVVIQKKGNEMDWDFVKRELKALSLEDFASTCLSFCKMWFGVASPLSAKEISHDFFELSTEKVFMDGVFGFENKENTKNYLNNEIRVGESYLLKMFRNIKKWFFPSYQMMIKVPKYSFLKGKPFLLPFAWIYRGIFARKHNREHYDAAFEESFSSKKQVKKRNSLLEQWGL